MQEGDKTNLVASSSTDDQGGGGAAADNSDNHSKPPPLASQPSWSPWQRQQSVAGGAGSGGGFSANCPNCPKCPAPRGMALIVLVSVVFSAVVTIALILTVIFGEPQVQKLGAVAADTTEASECGLQMLANGGSAVDAAVAAGLCGAVLQYPVTGLGGGGLMLVHNHRNDKTTLLDFLVAAPANATGAIAAASESALLDTALGTGVPGFMLGLEEAHGRFGVLKWPSLFDPAIRLATDGFRLSADLQRLVAASSGRIAGNAVLKRWYLTDAGAAKPVGALVTMPELAGALQTLRDQGAKAMYTGQLASEFLAAASSHGGRLTAADLAGYRVLERPPLVGHYRNFTVRTFPAPSSGGAFTLLVAQVLAGYPEASSTAANATGLLHHRAAEAMKLALGAVQPLGDASTAAATADVASPGYADRVRARIQDGRVLSATDSRVYAAEPWPPASQPASSQLVAVDNDELYVAMETSVYAPFATRLTSATGAVLLNNGLAGFELGGPGNHSNAPGPGRRPATLMAPAFAFNPRQRCGLRFAFGAANSTSVPGTAAWLLARLSDLTSDPITCPKSVPSRRRETGRQPCLPVAAAVASPRLNPLLPAPPSPPVLQREASLSADVVAFLGDAGQRLAPAPSGLGRAQVVAMDMYSLAAHSDGTRSGAKASVLPQSGSIGA